MQATIPPLRIYHSAIKYHNCSFSIRLELHADCYWHLQALCLSNSPTFGYWRYSLRSQSPRLIVR